MTKRISNNLKVGDQVVVHFTALAHGGSFVGEVVAEDDDIAGLKVFVRDVIPGEIALIRITENKGNFCEGELVELISPSADRIEPACPCKSCGGCDLQHIKLAKQRELKCAYVSGTLQHQAGVSPKKEITITAKDLAGFNYRRRITLHTDKNGQVGFYKKQSGEVVDCEKCLLAVSEINDILPTVKDFVKTNAASVAGLIIEFHTDEYFLLIKATSETGDNWQEILKTIAPKFSAIHVTFDNKTIYKFRKNNNFPFGHFCQVNKEANEILIKTVLAKITSSEISEFYAGAGNFSFPLAKAGKHVKAIELDPALVQYAEYRQKEENIKKENLEFITSSSEQYIKKHPLSKTILLDPPRSGARALVEACNPKKQHEIIYVSCNPATLARDIKILVAKGYTLEEVTVLDMFPQTQHVETVALLSCRKDESSIQVSMTCGID